MRDVCCDLTFTRSINILLDILAEIDHVCMCVGFLLSDWTHCTRKDFVDVELR